MDRCTLFENEVEDKKIKICKSINIAADKLILRSNYQPNQRPEIEKDVSLLKFMTKVNLLIC